MGIAAAVTKLHLGVVDIPYASSYVSARRAGSAPGTGSTNSTGDVAEILERRYGVCEKFVDIYGNKVAELVAEALQGKLESILMGAPVDTSMVLEEGQLSEIEELFRKMLDNRELDGKVPGVPTGASLSGVSHRFLHPHARRPARPSFIDTGQYQAAFRAWME